MDANAALLSRVSKNALHGTYLQIRTFPAGPLGRKPAETTALIERNASIASSDR
jgi:hypothetical protein